MNINRYRHPFLFYGLSTAIPWAFWFAAAYVSRTQKSYLKYVYHEKDDVARLFDIMREADRLIYATPVYIFTMTGLMKTLFHQGYPIRSKLSAITIIPAISPRMLSWPLP